MAIEFKPTFGARNTQTSAAGRQDQPKAQFWLNVGYLTEVQTDAGTEERFVALPMGIPLDTMDKLSTRSSKPNNDWAMFRAAQNDLLDQILEQANKLAPGADIVLKGDHGLDIQIRRVNAEVGEPPVDGSNPYVLKLFGVAEAA